MEKNEIALNLTLSIVGRIKPVDTTTGEAMNASLASEVAKAHNIILESIQESGEQENLEIVIKKPTD
jgi:hypothetical protein